MRASVAVCCYSFLLPTCCCWTIPFLGNIQRLPFGLPGQHGRDQQGLHGATGIVALGDSYSAGIGTTLEGKENECRQGLGAYPELLRADLEASQGPNASVAFQWLSCTGSTTDDLLSAGAGGGGSNGVSQIDAWNSSLTDPASVADLATLSVGGNDLGFFAVINACVFRFYSFYSGTCESALAEAEAAIASPVFDARLDLVLREILDKARWDLRPWFTVTVTGYARFFNADTEPCDDASFGVWLGGGGAMGPRLTRATRTRMNALVRSVNAKIRAAVAATNRRFASPRPKVLFVDYDALFDGHRFCEDGVAEPDYARNETWFFLVGGVDNAPGAGGGDAPSGPGPEPEPVPEPNPPPGGVADTTDLLLSPLSSLVDPDTCLGPAQARGDWGELALCYMAMAKQRDPSLRLADERFSARNSMWYVPTYYGKTFHPRSLGHEAVRDKIYQVWQENGLA